MKKTLILVVVMILVASSAFALTIVNSKHDLSSGSTSTVKSTGVNEICVFCHTPHGASTSMLQAPLWNRNGNVTVWNNSGAGYSSQTMNATSSNPGNASAVSKACLSCHDGNVADEALINGPGSANGMATPAGSALQFGGLANLNDAVGLANDHPIGIDMAAVALQDTDIYSAPQGTPGAALRLFAGKVECATCHKVHDNAISPFLATSNAASAMCLACHNK